MDKTENSAIENRKNQILSLVRDFCTQKLDDDYFELSERLLDNLGRERDVPFIRGKIEIWAAAVIHALCTINFLFDRSFKPNTTVKEINLFFGANKTSTGERSKLIRDLLDLGYFNNEIATQRSEQNNPYDRLTMVNGFYVFKDSQEIKPRIDSVPKTPPQKKHH